MGLHRRVDRFAFVLRLPADVGKQAEVFAELDPHSLGQLVLAVLLQGDPDVADLIQVVAEVVDGRLKAVYVNYGPVPARVLEVGPEDNGGFAETEPVPSGEETVINMPVPSGWDGPDLRIYVRYRALHGGPEFILYTDLLQWSSGGWGLLSEHEREQD